MFSIKLYVHAVVLYIVHFRYPTFYHGNAHRTERKTRRCAVAVRASLGQQSSRLCSKPALLVGRNMPGSTSS